MMDFDNFTITNPNWESNDCEPMGYIGKLDPNGNWLWVDKFDGIKDQRDPEIIDWLLINFQIFMSWVVLETEEMIKMQSMDPLL